MIIIVIVLNSFKCWATRKPSTFFRLNNFFITCTFLLANGLSYMPDKAFIISTVVFSFPTLCAIDLDRVNQITLGTCLSRRFHSSSSILSGFFPKRDMLLLLKEIIFNLHPSIPKAYSIKLLDSQIPVSISQTIQVKITHL